MSKDCTIVEAGGYDVPLEFYLKCEYVAAQLEVTVDYLLEEFYADGNLWVPDWVPEYVKK